jgi:hypothetical protein
VLKRPTVTATRHVDERVIKEAIRAFEKTGIDLKKINELAKLSQREKDRLKKQPPVKKALTSIKDPFRRGIEERLKTLKLLSTVHYPHGTDHVILDTPILIWSFPPSILDDAKIEPSKSIAKCHAWLEGGDDYDTLYQTTFYFLWQNNYGQEVIINAETFVNVKGGCFTDVNRRGFYVNGYAYVDTYVALEILELWNNPETSPLREDSQYIVGFANTFVDSGVLLGVPIGEPQSFAPVSQTLHPAYSNLLVPRNGSLLFQVSAIFETYARKFEVVGDVVITNTFQFYDDNIAYFGPGFIQCPFVHLEVIVPPVIT